MVILSKNGTNMIDMENIRNIYTEGSYVDNSSCVWANLKRTNDSVILGSYDTVAEAKAAVTGLYDALMRGEAGYKMP